MTYPHSNYEPPRTLPRNFALWLTILIVACLIVGFVK